MSLKVIGAGMPRTGTMSQKLALEQLGFGPCHHMTEVFANPWQWPLLDAAAEGRLGEWEELFSGYGSCTDAPGCYFWRDLAERYPEAKILLSLREPEAWFESMMGTIFTPSHQGQMAASEIGPIIRKMATRGFGGGEAVRNAAAGGPPDRAGMIAAFEAHNAGVIASVAPERLLVYRVSEGWEPLCRFLGVPVPAAPFPRVNSTEEFHGIQVPAGDSA
jgi:hypothetical protein